jgi:hypothetical protein
MNLNILTQMRAFVLTWALLVTALPSSKFAILSHSNCKTDLIDADGMSEISPRVDPASVLLGINCRGSSECGGYCHPNIGNIRYFVDQIRKWTRLKPLSNNSGLRRCLLWRLQSLLDSFH